MGETVVKLNDRKMLVRQSRLEYAKRTRSRLKMGPTKAEQRAEAEQLIKQWKAKNATLDNSPSTDKEIPERGDPPWD